MWDYKPKMNDWFDKDLPDTVRNGQRITTMTSGQKRFPIAPSTFKFRQHGVNGTWVSEVLPHTARIVDDLAVIKTVNTEAINHDPAITYIQTGSQLPGRPSAGAWLSYGLGSMNQNLPAFVVLHSTVNGGFGGQALYARLWGSGFLSPRHQGVSLRSSGDPVLYLSNPDGISGKMRRRMLDELAKLNRERFSEVGDPEIQSRIAQYEMAFRMQASVPEVMDIADEPPHVLERYGAKPGASSLANNCLLARRLAEKGVRFIHLFDWGWDFHGTNPGGALGDGLRKKCSTMDKPVAALINDLKQRGMLEDTLVVWGGEFGRTPFREGRTAGGKNLGRDHFPDVYTMMFAGGGLKPGYTYGSSDELGFKVASDKVHVHDLQATILHLLGLDHERLTYKFQGRRYRLTDVHGRVIHDLIA